MASSSTAALIHGAGSVYSPTAPVPPKPPAKPLAPGARPPRTVSRPFRTTLSRYDDIPLGVAVELVADEAEDELWGPRLTLIKRLFAAGKILGLQRLTTFAVPTGGAACLERVLVTLGGVERACVVTLGPAEAIRLASESLAAIHRALPHEPRLARELRPPEYEDGYGAVAHQAVLRVGGSGHAHAAVGGGWAGSSRAPSFADELLRALDDHAAGRAAMPDLRGGRDVWARGAPLHALALATAERSELRPLVGPTSVASVTLAAALELLVPLTPKQLGLYAADGDDECEEPTMADEAARAALGARLPARLWKALAAFRDGGHRWRAPRHAVRGTFFHRAPPGALDDAACAPLVSALEQLRRASDGASGAGTSLPAWAASWTPLCVLVHGNLHPDALVVDERRRLHYSGFEHSRIAPALYDASKLIAHTLCACVPLDDGGEAGGGGAGGDARLDALCGCIDALLSPNGLSGAPAGSLLTLCAVPLADVLPPATPTDLRAISLMAQQMLDAACKMVVGAGLGLGAVDEHDLAPINLHLPLLTHALELCMTSDLSYRQQAAAWHLTQRAAVGVAAFLGGAAGAAAAGAGAVRAGRAASPTRNAHAIGHRGHAPPAGSSPEPQPEPLADASGADEARSASDGKSNAGEALSMGPPPHLAEAPVTTAPPIPPPTAPTAPTKPTPTKAAAPPKTKSAATAAATGKPKKAGGKTKRDREGGKSTRTGSAAVAGASLTVRTSQQDAA